MPVPDTFLICKLMIIILMRNIDYFSSVFSSLIVQVGDAKDNVRKDVRGIIKILYKLYPVSKMFTFLMDGIKSKNAKQRMGKKLDFLSQKWWYEAIFFICMYYEEFLIVHNVILMLTLQCFQPLDFVECEREAD